MRKLTFALAALLAACGASNVAPRPPTDPSAPPTPSAKEKFTSALAAFEAHERARDWTNETCERVAHEFDEAAFAVALFDAGVTLERCHEDAKARVEFQSALRADPNLHRAAIRVALIDYRASRDIEHAIADLGRVVIAEQFQDPAALVDLAVLQDAHGDASAAKANIERALAIDDAFMPALDALARHHWSHARKRGSKPADVQELELAALVASQAMQKNASFAPIYNTAGIVQNELGHTHVASTYFERAAQLDPMLFEAHMNLGELNLSYRGYETAEGAFRRAIAIRPQSYDAHLGLALALRGRISGSGTPAQIAAVRKELDACKEIDKTRPEAFYNDAVLAQQLEANYDRAIAMLDAFKSRTRDASAVETANERIADAKTARDFVREDAAR